MLEFVKREIKLVIADDHEVVRAGIKRLLSVDKDIHIIDEASDGYDAVELVKYHQPDIAIIDIMMPRMTGIEAAKIIKKELPFIFVVMLTAFEDFKHIDDALSAGADGYLSKSIGAKELIDALRRIYKGERVLSKSIINTLQKKYYADKIDEDTNIIITKREQEILNLVVSGKTSQEIADLLSLSVRTVESHRYNIMKKLGVKNTAALVRYAVFKSDFLEGSG